MAKFHSRIKHFRSVITVGAMMTVPAACGGEAECPESFPSNGESCAEVGLECEYNDCVGYPTHFATCTDEGTWLTAVMSCNPPPIPIPEPQASEVDDSEN
ncbi:MAG: hypothetical protein KTR25_11235 [Myxococcales bacterium]|nr:hypothetical protein [Myxococcales bacterium]